MGTKLLNRALQWKGWRMVKHEEGFVDYDVTIDERIIFRNVLLDSHEGRQVLQWLLFNLGLFRPIKDDKEAVLQGFAIKVMNVLGLTGHEALEDMVNYYKVIADKDGLDSRKRKQIKEKLNER